MYEAKKLIDQLGGSVRVAKLCGVSVPAVSNWIRRNKIPFFRVVILAKTIENEVGTPKKETLSNVGVYL